MSVNKSKKPLILKRMMLKTQGKLQPMKTSQNIASKLIKLATIPLYREDVIFKSNGESFLPGEYQSITILNKLNNLTNTCKTIVRCVTHKGEIIEKTSDNITNIIGQEAYNTLFHALCSVINQEYRIKAMLSLLTIDKEKEPNIAQITDNLKTEYTRTDKSCQTDETRLELKKKGARRRIRKPQMPYVVRPVEKIRKITVDPFSRVSVKIDINDVDSPSDRPIKEVKKSESVATDGTEPVTNSSKNIKSSLPDLGYLHDDNSNDSYKTFSSLPSYNASDLLINPLSIIDDVVKHTKDDLIVANHSIILMDKTEIKVPFKPEDVFHIATRENMEYLDVTNRQRLLRHQKDIDCKFCMTPIDEDNNLPIHLAVINNDLELLKRQCIVLKIRKQNVDIPAGNGLTALKLSLFHESTDATSILLEHGADPLLDDEEHSTCAHAAAELKTDHLAIILHYCKMNARNIIFHFAEELQTPGWENRSDDELASAVLHHICTVFDRPGYSPLMLASKLGNYENVRLLVESVPHAVDLPMPTCGNTALYLAVAAACTASAERGNRSKVVDHFRKTIEILLEAGADPTIENNCGSNVNLLLQEFNCTELSMLIANKVIYMKFFNGEEDHTKNFDKYVLMKEGNILSIKEINNTKDDKTLGKNTKKNVEKHQHKSDLMEAGNKNVTIAFGNTKIKQEDFKLVKKECDVLVTKEVGNAVVKKEMDNAVVKKEIGNAVVKKEIGNAVVKKEMGNAVVKKEMGNAVVKKEMGNAVVTRDAGNAFVTKDISNAVVTKNVADAIVAKNVGNAVVTTDARNAVVTKEIGKTFVTKVSKTAVTTEATNKPIITENILIRNNRSDTIILPTLDKKSTIDKTKIKDFLSKPYYRMDTVPSVKKIIWYPPKRKAEECNDDVKRPKNT